MNIIDDIFSMMDYLENCEEDMSSKYHGELVDEYADALSLLKCTLMDIQ